MNRIFRIIAKRIRLFIAITVICIVPAALLYFNLTADRYEASVLVLIDNRAEIDGDLIYEDLLASQRLAENFKIFYLSGVYRDDILGYTGITPEEYESIQKNIKISIEKGTPIIKVTLHNEAGAALELLESISGIMIRKYTELTGVSNIRIIGRSETQESVREGLLSVLMLAGLLGGLAISIATVVIVDNSSDTIKSAEDIGKHFNVPVLGVIPRFKEERRGRDATEAV